MLQRSTAELKQGCSGDMVSNPLAARMLQQNNLFLILVFYQLKRDRKEIKLDK